MKKYSALRTIATILKVLGIIYGVLTILAALGSCLISVIGGDIINNFDYYFGYGYGLGGASVVAGIVIGLAILIGGGLTALLLYGSGESIYLLIDLEQNTRETADVLRIASGGQPKI